MGVFVEVLVLFLTIVCQLNFAWFAEWQDNDQQVVYEAHGGIWQQCESNEAYAYSFGAYEGVYQVYFMSGFMK